MVCCATALLDEGGIDVFDYDAELARYQQRLTPAVHVRPGDRVLDIGCGAGTTTMDAARAAGPGTALGVDVAGPALERARMRARCDGLGNVGFVQADAQAHAFPPEHFTLGMSRFGTMFFTDPVAAFTNIGAALRPGAPFVQLVWQAGDRQEWAAAIAAAITGGPSGPGAGAAFALADPDVVEGVLTAAGFTAVDVVDVREPVFYGPDADHACAAVLQFRTVQGLLAELDPAATGRAVDRLHAALAAHHSGDGIWGDGIWGDGIWFDSAAWLVTSRRP